MAKNRGKVSAKKPLKKVLKTGKPVKEKKLKPPIAFKQAAAREIPSGYNIDTIVLMPVNMDTSFIYWELTDNLLEDSEKKLKTGSAQLMLRVLEEESRNEVCYFEIKDRVGKSYINHQRSFQSLIAEVGVLNGKGFVGLLKSRSVSSPSCSPQGSEGKSTGKHNFKSGKRSAGPAGSKHEVWMTNKEGRKEFVSVSASASAGLKMMRYYRGISVSDDTPLFSKI